METMMKNMTKSPLIPLQSGNKKSNLTPFKKGKIFLVIITVLATTFLSTQKIYAEVWLSDNFNVTSGGGDLNYGIDSIRQGGSLSPRRYRPDGKEPCRIHRRRCGHHFV